MCKRKSVPVISSDSMDCGIKEDVVCTSFDALFSAAGIGTIGTMDIESVGHFNARS